MASAVGGSEFSREVFYIRERERKASGRIFLSLFVVVVSSSSSLARNGVRNKETSFLYSTHQGWRRRMIGVAEFESVCVCVSAVRSVYIYPARLNPSAVGGLCVLGGRLTYHHPPPIHSISTTTTLLMCAAAPWLYIDNVTFHALNQTNFFNIK